MKTRMASLAALCLCPLACVFAQADSLRITGRVTGFEDSTYLYLWTTTGDIGSLSDSARVVDGAFSFTYLLPEAPAQVSLTGPDYKPRLRFWADNVPILIEGDRADFAESRIRGSRLHEIAQEIHVAEDDPAQLLASIEKHIGSEPALQRLFFLKEQLAVDTLQRLYELIPEALRGYDYAKKINSYLLTRGRTAPQIGDMLIDFQAVDPEGNSHTLAELNDRYVLLEFGSTYCGPCFFAIPELVRLQMQEAKRLRIISFSMDTREETWRAGLEKAAKKEGHATLLQLWDGEGDNGEIPLWYGVRGMPTFFLFDPAGRVVAKWEGYREGKALQVWNEVLASRLNSETKE